MFLSICYRVVEGIPQWFLVVCSFGRHFVQARLGHAACVIFSIEELRTGKLRDEAFPKDAATAQVPSIRWNLHAV